MSENDLEQKAKTISDLAMSGQGCALAAQVKSMEAADIRTVFQLAQKEVDDRVTQSGKLPYVQFVDVAPDRPFAHMKVDLLDTGRDLARSKIFETVRGFYIGFAREEQCFDLKQKS